MFIRCFSFVLIKNWRTSRLMTVISIDDRHERGPATSGPFPRHPVELEGKQQQTENKLQIKLPSQSTHK